jgi:hypothetical protein
MAHVNYRAGGALTRACHENGNKPADKDDEKHTMADCRLGAAYSAFCPTGAPPRNRIVPAGQPARDGGTRSAAPSSSLDAAALGSEYAGKPGQPS